MADTEQAKSNMRESETADSESSNTPSRSREADWPAVLFFIHIHLLSTYGVWLIFYEAKLMTILLYVPRFGEYIKLLFVDVVSLLLTVLREPNLHRTIMESSRTVTPHSETGLREIISL
ncbi:hypothetical protein EVAR_89050_1 [Eumeta japonica]|uniref:Uncharacterized protein n=1 Tax=Eumeta variegata TaxID=151549 RepID=A0A4C1XJG1_EUMVA|nr:hypothetical protein EVAR_89050_1 [Eumeta japonica]